MNRYRFAITALAAMLLAGPTFAVDITPASSTSTRLSVTGFIQAYGTYYFNASQGPNGQLGTNNQVDGSGNLIPDKQFVDTIRTSRLAFNTITPNPDLGDISTTFEFDLAAPGGATNFRLRQAVGTWGNFTLGQTWSNWVDGDAAADEVDWNGPIGQAGDDIPRVPLAAYKWQLNKENSIILSFEHNSGNSDSGYSTNWSGASTPADAKYPNLVGVYQYYDKWGHIAVRGLAQNYGVYTHDASNAAVRSNKWGTAIQVSGQLNCFGLDLERDSLIYNVYTGSALGLYGVGFQAATYSAVNQNINFYKNTGWTVGYTHTWDLKYRSNLVLSGVTFQNDATVVLPTDIKSQSNVLVNTFVKLTKTAELGVEYMYESLKTFGPTGVTKSDGTTTDKNSSSKLAVELKYSF